MFACTIVSLNFQLVYLQCTSKAGIVEKYGTHLTQRRTPLRVLGYHSRVTCTRSSICTIGLELAVVLTLERKMVRAVLKIKK